MTRGGHRSGGWSLGWFLGGNGVDRGMNGGLRGEWGMGLPGGPGSLQRGAGGLQE